MRRPTRLPGARMRALLLGAHLKQPDELLGGVERVRDRPAVVDADRGPEAAVHLRDEGVADRGGARVELGQLALCGPRPRRSNA